MINEWLVFALTLSPCASVSLRPAAYSEFKPPKPLTQNYNLFNPYNTNMINILPVVRGEDLA